MSRVAELAQRREALVARSGALRAQLTLEGLLLEESLGGVERGIAMARSVASKPLLLAAGAGLLLLIRPSRLFRWVSRGLLAASFARRIGGLLVQRHARH